MPSPVARQAILLSGTAIKPVWQANFLSPSLVASQTLPAGLTYSKSGSIPATMFDSTGKLTYQGNNLYINSGSATNTARTISTTAGINYYIWVQTSSGSATVVASGTNSTTFNGSAGGTFTAFTATTGTLTLTPTSNYANITQVVVAQITYESALRTADNVVTGASIYLAPRLDTNPSTLAPAGLLVEQASSGNYAKYSQDFSQSAWRKYTSGAATGSISANSVTDPASTTTGAYISINRAAASEYAEYYQSFTGTAASWTGSFFLKAHAGGDVGKTVSIAAYNGSTVVAGTTVTLTASWVRYSVTGTMAASGSCNFAIGYVASTDYAGAPTQTGAVGFDVAFGQFDNTSFPLSYLPNPTASSPGPSRAADAINAPSYASNAAILQRKAQTTGTVDRIYYAPGALPEPFTTGYWYQSGAAYKRALTTQEQTPRLVVGGPY